jgi:energy-coupling factor transporter ATP-binding protein EcfA2
LKLLDVRDLSFTYTDQKKEALSEISFDVLPGEILYICGPTGAGKSTLLHCLKREIRPTGTIKGSILFDGVDMEERSQESLIRDIGIVFQNPFSQSVMDTVMAEMSFGLENIGISASAINRRLSEIAGYFGIEPLFQKTLTHLSGGERQMVNLCSVLAMRPRLLLLDEPVSQLDPVAQSEFTGILRKINEEFGITIIINEHKNEELMALADKVLFLDQGRMHGLGSPRQVVAAIIKQQDEKALCFMPASARLFAPIPGICPEDIPLTVREAKNMLQRFPVFTTKRAELLNQLERPKEAVLIADNILFSYADNAGQPVLKNLDLKAFPGDIIGIAGGNGSGKSTLLKILCGLADPLDGTVRIDSIKLNKMKRQEICRKIFYIPQNPLTYFTDDTVQKELESAYHNGDHAYESLELFISTFDAAELLAMHPYDLSGGERQKVLLLCALLRGTQILLLDEATKGLDIIARNALGQALEELARSGKTIIMVSHDLEFIASHATKCAMLFDGGLTLPQKKRDFFKDNYFYTTFANRIFRNDLPDVLTMEEVEIDGAV